MPWSFAQLRWGLDALELLLNYVEGLMPWSFCSTTTMELLLNYVEGLMPWSFCSTTTMELLLNHDDGAYAQPRR
jgi:hypothetical protein